MAETKLPYNQGKTQLLHVLAWDNVPVNGGSGTYVNVAEPGALLIDMTNFEMYINVNTAASPTWKKFTRAA